MNAEALDQTKIETPTDFRVELANLLTRRCKEKNSDTPDFILSDYIAECVDAFDRMLQRRSEWNMPSVVEEVMPEPVLKLEDGLLEAPWDSADPTKMVSINYRLDQVTHAKLTWLSENLPGKIASIQKQIDLAVKAQTERFLSGVSS